MANPTISQIKVGDITYDLCDASARTTTSLVNSNYTDIWDPDVAQAGWGSSTLYFKDSDKKIISYMGPYNYLNGTTKWNELGFRVQNENGGQHNFLIGINENGDAHVRGTTGLRNAWKSWMDVDELGTVLTSDISSNVATTSGSWKTLTSLALTKGIWMLTGGIYFASNATGRRYICIGNKNNAAPDAVYQRATYSNCNAVSGTQTYLHTSHIANVTAASTTLYLLGWQNSGGNLNMVGCFKATKIK